MAVQFTRSKDGIRRATMRVDFRVDAGVLETSAADGVWTLLVDEGHLEDADLFERAEEIAARVVRRRWVLEQARSYLRAHGYSEGALDDDYWEAALAAVVPLVRRLVPEAYDGEVA